MEKKLYRDETRKSIGGVCAGLADYFDLDVAIIRALFLLTFIFMGTGLMVYVVLWIVLPKKGYNYFNPHVDYRVPPQAPYEPFGNTPPQPSPFGSVPPDPENPFAARPKKGATTPGLIIGIILIFIGGSFLLHELHLFRFWHLGRVWPAVLVIGGFALMASGNKQKPGQQPPYNYNETQEEVKDESTPHTGEEANPDHNEQPPVA